MSNNDSDTETETSSEMSVMIDLNVDDAIFAKVAAVGARVVTDKDYFSIGVKHILQDKFIKKEPVEETE